MKTKEQLEKEIKKLQDELEALPKVTLKAGDLCEFWDGEEKVVGRYSGPRPNWGSPVDDRGVDWCHARKLETKATRIEWSGGDCPVDYETGVVVEYRSGKKNLGRAEEFDWDHNEEGFDEQRFIVAYWVLE